MAYYIANKIDFIRGNGDLVSTPDSARHMKDTEANNYVSIHPDHEIVNLGRRFKKNKNFVVSTKKQFIGDNCTVVNNMNDARSFGTIEAAYSYIDNIPDVKELLGETFVIDNHYKRMRRPEEQRRRQEYLESRPGQRMFISSATRNAVRKKSRYCAICGKLINDEEYSVDHVIPISRGGNNSFENLRPVHRRCNMIKDNMLDDELSQHATNITCYNLFNNPDDDSRNKIIRALVRGLIREAYEK